MTIYIISTQIQRSLSAVVLPWLETWAHHFDLETNQQSKQWKHVTSQPPVKFCRIASAEIMASVMYSGIVRGCWWLTTWSTWTDQETSVSYQEETTRKLESRSAVSPRQCTCSHLCHWHGHNSRKQIQIAQSPTTFVRPGSHWLPCVPIPEGFTSWINDWYKVQDKKIFVDGVNLLVHRWEKMGALEEDYIEKN